MSDRSANNADESYQVTTLVGMQCAQHVGKLCSLPNFLAHVVWGVRVTGGRRKASCLTDLLMRVNGFLQMGLCSKVP